MPSASDSEVIAATLALQASVADVASLKAAKQEIQAQLDRLQAEKAARTQEINRKQTDVDSLRAALKDLLNQADA